LSAQKTPIHAIFLSHDYQNWIPMPLKSISPDLAGGTGRLYITREVTLGSVRPFGDGETIQT